jgi:O-antigen ligase
MFRTIYIFLVVFPFLVIPIDKYVTLVKMGLLAYLCLSIWIFLFLKTYKQKEFPTKKKLYLPELFLLLYAIWAALSAILSDHPNISLFGTIMRHEGILALYSYFTIFFIAFRFAPLEKYKYMQTWFVSMSMVAGLYGVLQKFPISFLPFIDDSGRIESFFGNANFYGSYLVIMLLLAVILTLTTNDRRKTVLFFIAANFLFLNMLYTGTRSALVGIFMGLVFFSLFIWVKFPNLRKRYAGLLFTFVILFGAVNMLEGNTYLQRLFSILESAGQAIQNNEESGLAGSGRWKLWAIALPLVAENPVFGSGPDTLRYVYDQNAFCQYVHISNCVVDKAHNEYLQIAITMGIPALIFYLLFLSVIFWGIWKSIWKSTGEKQLFLAGFLALLIAYVVQAFFNISVVPVAPFFWFMLGIAYRLSQTPTKAIVLK